MTNYSEERLELLAQVASMYFEQGLNQADIAEQLGISRASVSRLINEAREQGVVEIRINFPLARDAELEHALSTRFPLQTVYVLNTKTILADHILTRLGRLASMHLQSRIRSGTTIAVSWGTAVFETVQALRRRQLQDLKVVQVIGAAASSNPLIDGPDLARQLAERLGGQYFYLHAPLVVENAYVRDTLLSDLRVQQTLALARQAHIAIVGIGSTQPEVSPFIRAGFLSQQEQQAIAHAGAVGDFCGYHIDISGALVDVPINSRVVGITLDDLHRIHHVVGVAGGVVKAPTILGVLRGELLHVLVTDDHAAREVLRLSGA